jgi:hypothetical protein
MNYDQSPLIKRWALNCAVALASNKEIKDTDTVVKIAEIFEKYLRGV